jgi:hypothetical protein
MDMAKIKSVLPKDGTGKGRRSVLRNRPDVGEIVCDLVLDRRTSADLARRTGVDYETVMRFKKKYLTDEVRKTILAEAQAAETTELDAKINAGQDDVQKGLHGIIAEQKEIYRLIRQKIGDGEGQRDIEDVVPALAQLLRDQGQSYERLLKSYTALKDKTTVVLSINESPEWSKLQEVLYDVFEQFPDAFASFSHEVKARGIRLE